MTFKILSISKELEIRLPHPRLVSISMFAMGLTFITGASTIASAQSNNGAKLIIEEVVVTGSNIRSRKKDFETPSPVQTLGDKEIKDTGAFQVQDIFKGLTANSGSQIANRQNALQGLSQFSLRGLGIGSTLTLINGRRAGLAPITDSSGQLFTDSQLRRERRQMILFHSVPRLVCRVIEEV